MSKYVVISTKDIQVWSQTDDVAQAQKEAEAAAKEGVSTELFKRVATCDPAAKWNDDKQGED